MKRSSAYRDTAPRMQPVYQVTAWGGRLAVRLTYAGCGIAFLHAPSTPAPSGASSRRSDRSRPGAAPNLPGATRGCSIGPAATGLRAGTGAQPGMVRLLCLGRRRARRSSTASAGPRSSAASKSSATRRPSASASGSPNSCSASGRGGRVYVVAERQYLTSPYCMYEIYEVWRNCRQDDEEFLRHVKVYTLPGAGIWTVAERARCAIHWRRECGEIEALLKDHGYDILGPTDARKYWLMKQFSNHRRDPGDRHRHPAAARFRRA